MNDCDDQREDEWPSDDEANDIMLAYASEEGSDGSGSGCAGIVLVLIVMLTALLSSIF
jgi:hypothetical protein